MQMLQIQALRCSIKTYPYEFKSHYAITLARILYAFRFE